MVHSDTSTAIKREGCDHQPTKEEEDGCARLIQNQGKANRVGMGTCGGVCINCALLGLIIYASSPWLAASLLTLGLVELLKNSRGHWRVFIVTAELRANKEAKINHLLLDCHHGAQHTPQMSSLPLQGEPRMLSCPKRRCRIAAPGATVSLGS